MLLCVRPYLGPPWSGSGEWGVGNGENASRSDQFFFPTSHSQLPIPSLLLLHELQRDLIDAVAQPGRPRSIIEDVAEMRAAAAAHHFDAAHTVTIVGFGLNILFRHRLPETGPASRSEEHTSELQSLRHLVCRLLLE